MTDVAHTEIDWEKQLTHVAYRTLRKGEMEAPGTGRYVDTRSGGVYECVGCGAPLFDSVSKVDDGSGYATFRAPLVAGCVLPVTHYTESGVKVNSFTCASCGGHIGMLDTMELKSSLDLEQGTGERLYHASSNAIVLKKALSVRNYPVGSVLMLLMLCVVGYLVWSWGVGVYNESYLGDADATIPLWVGDAETRATVVRLDQPNASTSGMVVRQGQALLLVLGTSSDVPAIRFANHSVDILWIDSSFTVVGWEQARASQTSKALDRPARARYALITQSGTLAPEAFASGYEVIVTDKTALL